MSLWSLVDSLPPEQLGHLYSEFPRNLRCLLGEWLESQPWEFITASDAFCAHVATTLFSTMMDKLRDAVNGRNQPGEILQHLCYLENTYQQDPLRLVRIMKGVLEAEKAAVLKKFHRLPLSFHRRQEELKFELELQRLQSRVQVIQALREGRTQVQGCLPVSMLDPQLSTDGILQGNNLPALFLETASQLEGAKTLVLKRLHIWKRQQQLAGNGTPFEENLAPLQKRCESLVNVYTQLCQEVAASSEELGPDLQSQLLEHLNEILGSLVKSSFLVEKQPPQVLKTQTKFQATVRFLLGQRLLKMLSKDYTVKADMVTEKQARELNDGSSGGNALRESTGEIVHNIVPLEINPASGICSAVFKNTLLKKIKRCERKGSESVTEEKCAVLFSTEVAVAPSNTSFRLQTLTLPIVVIVHGNQDNNAKATILWDNAFSETDRVPFVVAERVPWEKMCETLNLKFMAEVQTSKGLLKEHYVSLAQKIFNDSGTTSEDFRNCTISWAQFNKEILPGRGFTFWQWFDGVLELTKRCLKSYWSDRLIIGFISKQDVFQRLRSAPDGTFLLRFSDSEIGGITVAYIRRAEDGSCQVENIQPFSVKQLSIRSLGDCIQDLPQLKNLYPDKPKEQAFSSHCNKEQLEKDIRGYITTKIKMTVSHPSQPMDAATPSVNLQGLTTDFPGKTWSTVGITQASLNNPLGIDMNPTAFQYTNSQLLPGTTAHMQPFAAPQIMVTDNVPLPDDMMLVDPQPLISEGVPPGSWIMTDAECDGNDQMNTWLDMPLPSVHELSKMMLENQAEGSSPRPPVFLPAPLPWTPQPMSPGDAAPYWAHTDSNSLLEPSPSAWTH